MQIPARIYAGDSLTFTDSIPECPAGAGWVLSYAISNAGAKHTITASASGDDHQVSVAASATAGWGAGPYQWAAIATRGTERKTLETGRIEVLPDPAASALADPRSHVERTLAAIEATLEGKATRDELTIEIRGRALSRYRPEELLKWRDLYRAELVRERRAERAKAGLSGGKILVRFGR